MTKEEKTLLTKVLCEQLPHGIIVYGNYRYGDGEEIVDDEKVEVLDPYKLDWFFNGIEVKPYLRPLSSMTEEEAKDIATLIGIKDIISINITEKYIDVIKDDGFCSTETITIWFNEIVSSIEVFDYLNSNHFDYRGLIPMGLAIAAVGENNPYKEEGGKI